MKTETYTIQFKAIETALSRAMTISKTEYEKQLAFLMNQLEETKDNEFPMEHRTYTRELTGATWTQHYFTIGTADTILSETICKPGYHFK